MMNDFTNAIGTTPTAATITAKFKNGKTAEYTSAIFELLKTDKTV